MSSEHGATQQQDMEEKPPLPNQVPKSELYPGLENLTFQEIDGVFYQPGLGAKNFIEILEILKNLQLRSDDVFTVGYPRSGNNWVFEIVNMILRGDTSYASEMMATRILEYAGAGLQERIDAWESPRNLCCHIRMKRLPLDVIQKKIKVIYVIRNPKDMLNSMFRFWSRIADKNLGFWGSWDEFFKVQMAGKFPFGSWFDHVWSAETFMKEHPEVPMYIFCYEEAKQNPRESIQKLCNFLGESKELTDEICKKVEFDSMKQNGCEKFVGFCQTVFNTSKNVFLHKGAIGDWKNTFTVAQSEEFNKMFEKRMAGSELANYVRQYI